MRHLKFKNISRFNKAQAMIEFIIIAPVMLILILGIIQFALIYKAKITLNYATFQTARAGTINNASLSVMNFEFSSNMAPLYTTGYESITGGNCNSSFLNTDTARDGRIGTSKITQSGAGLRGILDANINNFNSDSVICARRTVQKQIEDGYVKISIVNPSDGSYSAFGVDGYYDEDGNISIKTMIPNDNLMYREANIVASGSSLQTIQDANLLKIHVGYCYELIIPFINRIVWAMQRYGTGTAPASEQSFGRYWADPSSTPPGFFGPPQGGFATSCITNPTDTGRHSIVLYSQAVMRMQSPAVQCERTDPNSC